MGKEKILLCLITVLFFIGVISFISRSIDVLIILAVIFCVATILIHYMYMED